jgi:hypothetical protein
VPEFEVAIYNEEVREKVRSGSRHRDLTDDWAEIYYIEVEAKDENDANQQILRKYPKNQGYVIESVIKVQF